MTKQILNSKGVEFKEINIDENPEYIEFIINELGFSSAPVIVSDIHAPFSGFRPDKLQGLK